MRRSAALAPLSQDHHHALVIASVLTRAGDATARSSAMLFADFILEHEARHFALEEALLLPALPAGERSRELSQRVCADHRYLRDAARQLMRARVQPSVDLVGSIGRRLRAHVQLEERELFPYLEESLDVASLERIGSQLERADAEPPDAGLHAEPPDAGPDAEPPDAGHTTEGAGARSGRS